MLNQMLQSVYDILEELRADNNTNYKMDYNEHELLKQVLKMAYDRADYNHEKI